MTIAKPRTREALGRSWAGAGYVCGDGRPKNRTSHHASGAGAQEPADQQGVWVVMWCRLPTIRHKVSQETRHNHAYSTLLQLCTEVSFY